MDVQVTRETALTITAEEVVQLDEAGRLLLVGLLTNMAGEGMEDAFRQAMTLALHPLRAISIDTATQVELAYRAFVHPDGEPQPYAGPGPGDEIIKRGLKSGRQILDEGSKEVPWIVEALLPSGAVTLVTGGPKSGKTTAMLAIMKCMEVGSPWAGQEVEKGVAWVFTEEGSRSLSEGMRTCGIDAQTPHRFFQNSSRQALTWDDICQQAGNYAASLGEVDPAAHERPKLIIFDTFGSWVGTDDINDYAKLTKAFAPLQRLRDQTGCAVVALHHQRKSEGGTIASALGSTALTAQADNVVAMAKGKGNVRILELEGRFRDGLTDFTATFDPQVPGYLSGTHDIGDDAPWGPTRHELAVLAVFSAWPTHEMPMRYIVENRPFGMGSQRVKGVVRRLTERGELVTNGYSKTDPRLTYIMAKPADHAL